MEGWNDDARDRLAQRVMGETWFELRRAVLYGQVVGEAEVVTVHDRVARLFACESPEALGILGISRSHKLRARMSVEMLDRVVCAVDAYSRVDRMLGTYRAQRFFQYHDDGFGRLRAIDLLRSRVGTQYLNTVITSLEHGVPR